MTAFPGFSINLPYNYPPTEYNGWKNYETWNVALWLQNDEGLYEMARNWAAHGYKALSHMLMEITTATPDGVAWNDSNLDMDELNEMMAEL